MCDFFISHRSRPKHNRTRYRLFMQSRPSPVINERLALLVLAAVQFTHILDFMIMMPLGSQLMRVFEITPAQFSHLVAAYGLSAAVTGFLGGFVIDRFDRRHALLTLYAGFGLATLACALAPNYAALLGARILAGGFGGVAGLIVITSSTGHLIHFPWVGLLSAVCMILTVFLAARLRAVAPHASSPHVAPVSA